ncbi:MAG: hypothetical protein ACP5K7_13785, partial [Verrucomicrobiia bacterium]
MKIPIITVVLLGVLMPAPAQQGVLDTNKVYIMGTNLPPEDLEKIRAALPSVEAIISMWQREDEPMISFIISRRIASSLLLLLISRSFWLAGRVSSQLLL